jgi:hypothetical protein
MKFGITLQLRGNLLILYREVVAVYCENHIKHVNKLCGQITELFNVKAGCIDRVIQEELPSLMELISEDILSKKCHINMGPILNIYRVMFVIGIFLNFNFNYKITSS